MWEDRPSFLKNEGVSVILCLTCLRVLVCIPPIIGNLRFLFCLHSSNICQYTGKLLFSAVKVIFAAGVGDQLNTLRVSGSNGKYVEFA